MSDCSLLQKFFKSCQRTFRVSKPQPKPQSHKISLKTQPKQIKCSTTQKISLKNVSAKKMKTKTHQPKVHPVNAHRCLTNYENLHSGSQQILAKNYERTRSISPHPQIKIPMSPKTQPGSTWVPNSPCSVQRQTLNLHSMKSVSYGFDLDFESYPSGRVESAKEEKEKGFYGEKTREKTIQEQSKPDPEKEGISFKKYKQRLIPENDDQRNQSHKTLLSVEEMQSNESKIKIEQSQIVVDYFHPKQSERERWGVTLD